MGYFNSLPQHTIIAASLIITSELSKSPRMLVGEDHMPPQFGKLYIAGAGTKPLTHQRFCGLVASTDELIFYKLLANII